MTAPGRWRHYAADLQAFRAASPAGTVIEPFPQTHDKTATTPVDAHYVHQGPWVARHLRSARPGRHVDVGSSLMYLGFFAAEVPTVFLDIRPAGLHLPALDEVSASVLALPFATSSVRSLSCLHVIEHVGLGRYGDPLDPAGSDKAAAELARVLAPGGDLYLSLPVGRARVCFNAHRVHSTREVLRMFSELRPVSIAAVLDDGSWAAPAEASVLDRQEYACGLFHFRKESGG